MVLVDCGDGLTLVAHVLFCASHVLVYHRLNVNCETCSVLSSNKLHDQSSLTPG